MKITSKLVKSCSSSPDDAGEAEFRQALISDICSKYNLKIVAQWDEPDNLTVHLGGESVVADADKIVRDLKERNVWSSLRGGGVYGDYIILVRFDKPVEPVNDVPDSSQDDFEESDDLEEELEGCDMYYDYALKLADQFGLQEIEIDGEDESADSVAHYAFTGPSASYSEVQNKWRKYTGNDSSVGPVRHNRKKVRALILEDAM